jgi:transposase
MLSLPPTVRIFLCTRGADMRRSFDGLAVMVEQIIGQDPLSGHLFLFCNRRGDRVKLLYWDGDGYALWYKRLEEGTFRMPTLRSSESESVELRSSDLMMLLEGVDLTSVKRQHRYARQRA